MSKDIWSHSHDWDLGYAKGHKDGYEQGRADRDKEITENNVFFSNRPIEDIVLETRADERANLLKEICEHERTMIDDDGKIHFVVKMVDVIKVFNKEQK